MLVTNVDLVCKPDDQLREILDDLGAPGSEEAALGAAGKRSSHACDRQRI